MFIRMFNFVLYGDETGTCTFFLNKKVGDFVHNRNVEEFHTDQFSKIMSRCSSNLKQCHLGLLYIPMIVESIRAKSKHLQIGYNLVYSVGHCIDWPYYNRNSSNIFKISWICIICMNIVSYIWVNSINVCLLLILSILAMMLYIILKIPLDNFVCSLFLKFCKVYALISSSLWR
jgi:hypothetical protein